MQWLSGIIVQILKWILPLAVHELAKYYQERKHQKAVEKMASAKTEEEQREAIRDMASNL